MLYCDVSAGIPQAIDVLNCVVDICFFKSRKSPEFLRCHSGHLAELITECGSIFKAAGICDLCDKMFCRAKHITCGSYS